MVATVYTPNGIVVATASYDSFHEHLDTEDGIQISPINIEGLTHTYLFYNKYSLTFNGLNSYTMSRKSAAIIIEEEDGIYDYKLRVLNATNKVTVNNQRIKEGSETYLDFGDIIILGNSKFKFDNH